VRANLPKEWIAKRKRDQYYRRAKEERYRSRAAYKLLEVVKKYNFIKSGDVVVDLGAAPGSWLQVSRRIVGEEGFVLGVDLRRIKSLNQPNVYTMIGDVRDPDIVGRIMAILPRPADVVISDVSPKIIGVWELDHARQIDLAEHSLRIAKAVLTKKGNFLVKAFQGDLLNNLIKKIKKNFYIVRLIKPKASRAESSEIYILALKYKGRIKHNNIYRI